MGARPPSCNTPQELTIYSLKIAGSAREGYSKNSKVLSYSPKSILFYFILFYFELNFEIFDNIKIKLFLGRFLLSISN